MLYNCGHNFCAIYSEMSQVPLGVAIYYIFLFTLDGSCWWFSKLLNQSTSQTPCHLPTPPPFLVISYKPENKQNSSSNDITHFAMKYHHSQSY